MRIPLGVWKLGKEILRHLLRRPVVGVCVVARSADDRVLLVRRADTGLWALPGGTLEWGETLRDAVPRELREEAGAELTSVGFLLGVYSDPERDPRFHAVTVVVAATVDEPRGPDNPVEILEARLFPFEEIPSELSHGTRDMLENAWSNRVVWE
ncbi:MAG TPA: NUDIX hydrolase [Polyangiaceae bacterium]|nr:NUDIX hydrolase [Polyangiaceae bacterium]